MLYMLQSRYTTSLLPFARNYYFDNFLLKPMHQRSHTTLQLVNKVLNIEDYVVPKLSYPNPGLQ